MDLSTGRRNRVPVAQLVRRTLRAVEPHARELGGDAELEGVLGILEEGPSAVRQRRLLEGGGDLRGVVAQLVDDLADAR
jgi:gamma-glutamyl:cysteine ligase YbdK (ATP-grasp superfamily)